MLNSFIWSIDRTLLDATTPRQSGSMSKGNERVLHIPQISVGDFLYVLFVSKL